MTWYDLTDMWEMRVAHPFGRLSIRKLLLLVAGLLATIFGVAFATTSVSAQTTPDAVWEGSTIVYEEKTYIRDASNNGQANDPRGIPEGAIVFSYNDVSAFPNTLHLIYFPSNSDPSTATQALYISMTYTPPETYSNHSEPLTLNIEPFNNPDENTTSCNQEGVGWIICPLTNWLAKGMDTLYTLISGFLEVRPAQTNTENALYRVWSVMRNFANIIFVIGFLVIIYSQITSFGVSNYHIKKMLPRLVIAAILVNVSYWICAIAIDASNILGYSIQDIFMNVRENLVGEEGNNWDLINWQSITGAILSLGAGATAVTIGVVSFVGSGGASIFLLLPILVGVLMAVIVALLIMAARQAIITILLVISPLAFVAFLLPNTEKYFEKWRSLGTTMLLMFPIFSVLFGGSQLAGALIIQNADQINLVILGLAVQVAPLVITPLLIRFSGSILGRIAGIVNNPNKGLIDRTRRFAEERAGQMKSRQLAKGNNWLANRARGIDRRRRNREGWQKSHDAMTEANWANTSKAHDIHKLAMKAADVKEIGENHAAAAYHASKATSAEMQNLDIKARASKLSVDLSKAKIDANWEEMLAGRGDNIVTPEGLSLSAMDAYRRSRVKPIHDASLQSHIENRRAASAQDVHKQNVADELLKHENLQIQAGGIGGKEGADSALAAAVTAKRQAYGDAVKEATQILRHFNPDGNIMQDIAMGRSVTVTDGAGNEKIFDAKSTYAREAAIEMQLAGEGSYKQIEEIIMKSGSEEFKGFATTIGSAIADNKLASKAAYLGGQTINDVKQGKIKSSADLDKAVAKTIAKGKIKPEHLATMDVDAIARMVTVAKTGMSGNYFAQDEEGRKLSAAFEEQIAALKQSAVRAAQLPSSEGKIASNVWDQLEELVGYPLRPRSGGSRDQSGN
jgi:hypothetical protein